MVDTNYGSKEIEEAQVTTQFETMTEEDIKMLGYVNKRRTSMDNQRSKEAYKWDIYDDQVRSEVPDTRDGKTNINMPIEQNIIELYLGLKTALLSFKVESDGIIDGALLELNRHILDHFLDKENAYWELKRYYYDKAKYGSGVLHTGVRFETQIMPEGNDYFNIAERKEITKDIRHIGIRNIPIRKIWFDEQALSSKDAMDCIYQEDISIEQFKLRYSNKEDKGFKYIGQITAGNVEDSNNTLTNISTERNVKLRHYFNRLSGKYCIVANKGRVIYNGRMTTKHGQLPFVLIQHYIRTDCLYGFGVCEKLASVKPYINALLKVGIDNAWVNSGRVFATGNDTEIDGEYYVNPGDISIWKFNGDIDKGMREMPGSAPIIQWIEAIINLIEDYGIQNTGINLKAPYTSPASTAFEAGLMVEQQNARVRTVDEDNNIGIGHALTLMLSNIHQFGPTQMAEYMYDENGTLTDYTPYSIKIEGKKIDVHGKGKNKEIQLLDDETETAFFDLTEENLFNGAGLKVKIETSTTQSLLPSLEKQEFTDALQQVITLKQLFPELNIGDGGERWDRYQKIRGFDLKSYSVKTKQQKMREEQAQMMDVINNFDGKAMGGNPMQATIPGFGTQQNLNHLPGFGRAFIPNPTNGIINPTKQTTGPQITTAPVQPQ